MSSKIFHKPKKPSSQALKAESLKFLWSKRLEQPLPNRFVKRVLLNNKLGAGDFYFMVDWHTIALNLAELPLKATNVLGRPNTILCFFDDKNVSYAVTLMFVNPIPYAIVTQKISPLA